MKVYECCREAHWPQDEHLELMFLAGRAVFSTVPQFIAAPCAELEAPARASVVDVGPISRLCTRSVCARFSPATALATGSARPGCRRR